MFPIRWALNSRSHWRMELNDILCSWENCFLPMTWEHVTKVYLFCILDICSTVLALVLAGRQLLVRTVTMTWRCSLWLLLFCFLILLLPPGPIQSWSRQLSSPLMRQLFSDDISQWAHQYLRRVAHSWGGKFAVDIKVDFFYAVLGSTAVMRRNCSDAVERG